MLPRIKLPWIQRIRCLVSSQAFYVFCFLYIACTYCFAAVLLKLHGLECICTFCFQFYSVKKNCFFTDAKRLIGRRFEDSTVQSDMKHWPFTVVNEGGKPKIRVQYKGEAKTFFPEEISSMVLVKMKETAEAYLGKVIPIKKHFNFLKVAF